MLNWQGVCIFVLRKFSIIFGRSTLAQFEFKLSKRLQRALKYEKKLIVRVCRVTKIPNWRELNVFCYHEHCWLGFAGLHWHYMYIKWQNGPKEQSKIREKLIVRVCCVTRVQSWRKSRILVLTNIAEYVWLDEIDLIYTHRIKMAPKISKIRKKWTLGVCRVTKVPEINRENVLWYNKLSRVGFFRQHWPYLYITPVFYPLELYAKVNT